ncbi:hypothetical protein EI94DRAFT_1813087 [Lactarius quietus]|nr:hypothetical protein EI94DRAFT_1813087 [Lactarius quietus]
MSTPSTPTSHSSKPIDISTPPPPSVSPPPLPQSPLPLLNCIHDGPSSLSLEEHIGLDVAGSPPLMDEQTTAIQEIIGRPIRTREQIDKLLARLVNRPEKAYDVTPTSSASVMTTVTTNTMSTLFVMMPIPPRVPMVGSWKQPPFLTTSPFPKP